MQCHDTEAISKTCHPPIRDVRGSGCELPTPEQSRCLQLSFLRLMEEPVLPGCAWVFVRSLLRSISSSEAFRSDVLAAVRWQLRVVLSTLLILAISLSPMAPDPSGGEGQLGHRLHRHNHNHHSASAVTVRAVLPDAESCLRTKEKQTSVQADHFYSLLSPIDTPRVVVLHCAFRPIRC
jgi:hypothetical protein